MLPIVLDKTPDEIKSDIEQLKWFHTFEIVPGVITPGVDPTLIKLKALQLPEDLTGKTVLDIGAYNGFFSFECESRGAQVTANDFFVWFMEGIPQDPLRCFLYLRSLYGSKTEMLSCRVEDLDPSIEGTFDIVLFMGVLYHTKYPYLYLEKAAEMTKEVLVLETLIDCCEVNRPAAAFYPKGSLNNDPTTHWGLNTLAIRDILQELGFSRIDCFPPWDVNTVSKTQSNFDYSIPYNSNGRQVIHAYR